LGFVKGAQDSSVLVSNICEGASRSTWQRYVILYYHSSRNREWAYNQFTSQDHFSKTIFNYITRHPLIFGLQVLGGTVAIASALALPILGALGFTAAGPLAGSAAATWQSSIGIVQGGSLFAWCQSAAMGGAAVGGILVTGLTGAGIAVGATVAGELDAKEGDEIPNLKEGFLSAWKRDVDGTGEKV
jgi:hypothetical protein